MATVGVPRRKSAHGRLQSSTSAALANTSSEGAGGKEVAQRELARSRRVKSAREPQQPSTLPPFGRDASTWGRTQYEDEFGHKQPLTPVPVRPISPTRMNNPHPAMVSRMAFGKPELITCKHAFNCAFGKQTHKLHELNHHVILHVLIFSRFV